jgi:hypothetical protein
MAKQKKSIFTGVRQNEDERAALMELADLLKDSMSGAANRAVQETLERVRAKERANRRQHGQAA